MEIEVNMLLKVDPESNFLECNDEDILNVVMGFLKDRIYDIDDIELKYIDLEKV